MHVVGLDEVEHKVANDVKLEGIIHDLLYNPKADEGYSLRNGRLLYHDKLVLPKGSSFIPKVFKEFHSSPYRRHSGFFRTYKKVVLVLFWEGIKNGI